jgi:hypothetical protein
MSALAALPPAFTARERAKVDAYFGKAARSTEPAGDRAAFLTAAAVVLLMIAVLFAI